MNFTKVDDAKVWALTEHNETTHLSVYWKPIKAIEKQRDVTFIEKVVIKKLSIREQHDMHSTEAKDPKC